VYTTVIILVAAVLATIASQTLEQLLWPNRRRAVLGAIDTTLAVTAQVRLALEVVRRDPNLSGLSELVLVDLSEHESRLKRDRTVLQWT
jgi:hypothetical protein